MRLNSKRGVRWAAVLLPAVFAMLAVSHPQANSLLEGLKREAENAIRRKANEVTQKEVVECAAGDEKCARKAAKQGKEVRVVQPAAATAGDAGGTALNPLVAHPLDGHPAYVLAKQIRQATSEQEVAELMRTAFGKMRLGIYSHTGQRIQAGAERNASDFFLYDFQWKMVARAYFQRSDMRFADHAAMLGAALLEVGDPAVMQQVLPEAMERRYREAAQKPDDPMSFAILLIDGLARHHEVPFEVRDMTRYRQDAIRVDPLQSALIMIDFFTRPPARKPRLSFDWMPSLVSSAHAQDRRGKTKACDELIKGFDDDDSQGYWGRGTDILTEVGGQLPGQAGKIFSKLGDATGVVGAIGDLLVLYGMSIHLEAQPNVIHLDHPDQSIIAAVLASVSFDAQGVPDKVLECGWLTGKSMPSNGAFKDVELTWDIDPWPSYLEMHTEMWRGDMLSGTGGGFRTTTDAEGKSNFLLDPQDCPYPKGGVLRGSDHMVSVDARFVTKSIPTPGLLGIGLFLKLGPGLLEYAMRGRSGHVRLRVEWHERAPRPPYGGASRPPG